VQVRDGGKPSGLSGTEIFPVAIVGAGRALPGSRASTVQYVTLYVSNP
jgi:hypothetical protein